MMTSLKILPKKGAKSPFLNVYNYVGNKVLWYTHSLKKKVVGGRDRLYPRPRSSSRRLRVDFQYRSGN